jgi:hypothetical protein
MNEADLRERLTRAADVLPVADPPTERMAARGRRRQVGRRITAGVSALVVMAASAWALFALRPLETAKPSDSPLPAIARFDVGGRPIRPVAIGYGAGWFIVQDGEEIVLARVDDATGEVRRVEAAGLAGYVALGAGSVWAATCAEPNRTGCGEPHITRIDPGSLREIATIPLPNVALVSTLAFGAGSVWAGGFADDPVVFRIDASTNEIRSVLGDSECCRELTYGEGAIWGVASGRRHDRDIARIDLATEEVTYVELTGDQLRYGASTLAAGEGAVWVGVASVPQRSSVARLDPGSGRVTHVAEEVGSGWFTAGEGGLWIARTTATRCVELLRLDASDARAEVQRVVAMGETRFVSIGPPGSLLSVGVGEGAAWITIDSTGEVIRIDLDSLDNQPVRDPGCVTRPRFNSGVTPAQSRPIGSKA